MATLAVVFALALGTAGRLDPDAQEASARTQDPASSLESTVEAFVHAYNLNEPGTLADFIRTHYAESLVSTEADVRAQRDSWLRAYSLVGPVELRHVEAEGARRMRVWTYGLLTRTWLAFVLEVVPDGPRPITTLSIFSTSRPPALDPGPRLDPSELPEYLQPYLDALASVDAFSGVALLVNRDEVIWSFAAGFTTDDRGQPLDIDSVFDLASVSKMFSGVATLLLHEAGRVDLEAPVSQYLAQFPAHIGDEITLARLLSHRTGIRLQEDAELYERIFRAASFDEQFALEVEAMERAYGPGFVPSERYVYSNEDIDIAARVLETQAGTTYYELLRDSIFEPLGMKATRPFGSGREDFVAGRTRMHPPDARFVPGPRRSNRFFLYDAGRPSGGMVTTGRDMAAFCTALMKGSLLDETSLGDLTAPLALQSVTADYELYYGLGADVYVYETGRVFGHGGGRPGTSTRVDVFPDLDVSLVVLSNYDYIAHRIAEHVHEILMVGAY